MSKRRYDHRRPAPGGFISSVPGDVTRLMSTAHTLAYEALGLVGEARGWTRRGGGLVGQWLLLAPDGTVRLEAAFASSSMSVRGTPTPEARRFETAIALPTGVTAEQIARALLALLPADGDADAAGGGAGQR